MPQSLMSPLSASEITALLGGIRDAAQGTSLAAAHTAVRETVRGLREWCGDAEVTLAVMSFAGLQPQPAVTGDLLS